MLLPADDPILALPVFPSWECEDQHGAQTTVGLTVIWDLRILMNIYLVNAKIQMSK